MPNSRYQRTQILLEPDQHNDLDRIARREGRSLSEVIREMLRKQIAEQKRREMSEAARALLSDYANDKELTAFTALDAEDIR